METMEINTSQEAYLSEEPKVGPFVAKTTQTFHTFNQIMEILDKKQVAKM